MEKKLLKENDRLAKLPFGSAEASVLSNYLDVCLDIPWKQTTRDRVNIEAARKILNIRRESDILGDQVVRVLDPADFVRVLETGRNLHNHRVYLAEYDRYVEQTIVYDKEYHLLVGLLRDVTQEESVREQKESISRQTVEIADKVIDKQMRIVQEIASLLGETAAETKIALTKLKESIADE